MRLFFKNLEEYLVAFLLAVITATSAINVFYRYVLESSIGWVFELNTFLFAWLIFIGAAWGFKTGIHIGVDAFVTRLSKEGQRIASIIAVLCCLLYAGLVLYGGALYVYKIYKIGILSQDIHWLPQWIPRLILPLSFALIAYRLIATLIDLVRGQQSTFHLANEAEEAIASFSHNNGDKP